MSKNKIKAKNGIKMMKKATSNHKNSKNFEKNKKRPYNKNNDSRRKSSKTNIQIDKKFEDNKKNEKDQLLIAFMGAKGYYPMNAKKMCEFLEVPAKSKDDFYRSLDRLEKKNKIFRRKSGYVLVGKDTHIIGTYEYNKEKSIVKSDVGNKVAVIDDILPNLFVVNGDSVIVELEEKNNKDLYKGKIVKVAKHKKTSYVGTYKRVQGERYVLPEDRKIGKIIIKKGNELDAKDNQKVVVKIINFPVYRSNATGEVTEILGNADEAGLDMECLIRDYNLPNEFPDAVIDAANKIPDIIDPSDIKNRVDLRNQKVFTIDGEDAKDLDDGVSIEKTDRNTYILYVHIADVSHYVTENSVLDKEAVMRGTSIYMLDRVIPMLPKKLSNGICSLNYGEDRYTLSVKMEIDKDGYVINSKIFKGVINVTERMSYNLVQAILDKSDEEVLKRYEPYISDFELMAELAIILQNRRKNQGSLDLDIPESKVILDEKGHPVDIKKVELKFANHIVEQFMLTANETVAETFNKLEAPFIYRVHESPDRDKVKDLNKFLWNMGYKIRLGKEDEKVSPKAFAEVLEEVKGSKAEIILSSLILRTMKVARYEKTNEGHFGIASNYYCHFTSPIRRYPDLFIHRVISEYLKNNNIISDDRKEKLDAYAEKYAKSSTDREKIAQKVEWDSNDMKIAEYMQEKIGEKYDGIVSNVTSFGIFVQLENSVEGLVRFDNLGDDYYVYDEDTKSMRARDSKEVITIGDPMKIMVIDASKETRRVTFSRIIENSNLSDDNSDNQE